MARRTPEGPPPPPAVQRLRIRYAKRGRLRFTSHRDFARALERALRRADVPMAFSAGFSPHPKISYVGAAPTGAGSEAEYLEISVTREVDPAQLRAALDAALPDGLDVLAVTVADGPSLAARIEASVWRIEVPGVRPDELTAALAAFMARDEVPVERLTKDGRRTVDARHAVVSATVSEGDMSRSCPPRAIMDLVVRQETPSVRPDDIMVALRTVAGLALAAPPVAVRLAQGPLDDAGAVGDPMATDGAAAPPSSS
jgi:radical SAM-linked protein